MQPTILKIFRGLLLVIALLPVSMPFASAQSNLVPDDVELAVLKKLYDSLGGANWTNKTNWPTLGNWPATATATQFASWRGVSVSNGDIAVITLSSNNLVGKLPSNIGDLTSLTSLVLKGNTISGKIPATICNLTNLKILQLQTNRLTGAIPAGIGAMTSLEDLELQGNLLTGTIPPGLGSLSNLVNLYLFSNDLTDSIPPELSSAGSLQSLQLQGNALTGTIPAELGSLSQLHTLMLYNNQLSGSIPAQLGALSHLEYLHLYSNALTGHIPPELGNLSSLKQLRLNDNQLSGSIPATLGNIVPLQELYLDENELSGVLPATLGKLSNLTYLAIADNRLSGSLPNRFGRLSSLRTFYFNGNEIEGPIPDSLRYLSQLRVFYGSNNNLSGSLPWIGNTTWPELTHLVLNDNLLSGVLPAGLGTLTKVKLFNISNNDFSGTIPAGCESWNDLITWSSYGNDFTGPLHPNLFANKPALGAINVSGNRHEGAFPSISGSLSLVTLRATDNFFTALPAGLLDSQALVVLNFTNNELTTLPDLSAQVNKTKLSVAISNSRLDFSAMEPAKIAGLLSATLTPQKNFRDITSIDPQEGQPLVITARPAGTGTIAWERLQADGVTWANVDALNQDDGNPLTFRINAYNKAPHDGFYRYTISKSPAFPGIILRSDPIRVMAQLTLVLDEWAFQYIYDTRSRPTHKKVPGAGWVYMVYDNRDRLVLTQDAEQRKTNKWSFTKYDVLNRPVLTGIYTHPSTLTQEEMSALISTSGFHEARTGDAANHGYTNSVFPTSNLEFLTVTYYDNYDFKAGWDVEYDYAPNLIDDQVVNGHTYSQGNYFNNVNGQVTGTKVRTLEGEPYWMHTVRYYDNYYRPLQVITDNYKNGIDRVTNVFDFVGLVIATKTDHLVSTITWQNVVNVTITDDKVSKSTSGSAWSTAGASSVEKIAAGADGWVEVTVGNLNTMRIFGLSDQDVNQDHTTVDYGFLIHNTTLSVRINGAGFAIPGALTIGDKLRIARKSGLVSFYRNGVKVFPTGTTTYPNTSELLFDLAFYDPNSAVTHARMSAAQGSEQTVERWLKYDHAGRLEETWHSLNGATPILLVKNKYNELGQLADKKLHSTVSTAADARQSVDYRYNIRGWLTSINNAALTSDAANDDTNDLFGMNLAYNTGIGIVATPQFNGNISAVKYSKDMGKGDVKQRGYAFAYDLMNRLTDASHRQLTTTGTWISDDFDEAGITYDMNGNIQTLQRKGAGGALIDNLKYIYSNSDNAAGNKLLSVEDLVTDAANKAKGFADGNQGTTQDYTYDANGNMTRDLNKGIGTSLTDGTNVITYNYLNLPQTVSKGGSTIRYVYDATGRKLAQYVISGASKKRTDYIGEFVYEDNALQFLNHEEGRIVMSKTKLVYTNGFDVVDANKMTAVNTGLATYVSKGEKYVTATASSSGAGNGVFPIGDPIIVDINERYRVRVKAYAGASAAYLQTQIKSNGSVVSTSTAVIPNNATSECWIEQVVTTPASGDNLTLETGVVWNSVSALERMYLNEIEVIKLETTTPEYQYHLKDHLGNVRLTFTTKEEAETNKATMEPAQANDENSQFSRYEDVRLMRSPVFDHTNDNNQTSKDGYAVVLRGGDKETTGLVKTLSVMPGDVINMKVYAKYMGGTRSTWPEVLTNLAAAVANGMAGIVSDGAGYPTKGFIPFEYLGDNGTEEDTGNGGPRAYLNYIMFDRDFNPIIGDNTQTFFRQVSTNALEDGSDLLSDANGAPHELLEATVTAKQAGFLYIYLSNEEDSPVEVFFDDFEVVHTKGPVVQSEEYYPFGLTFNGYQRENSGKNRYLYNQEGPGKKFLTERVLDLEINLDLSKYRSYDYVTGRWLQIDPKAETDISVSLTPYNYGYDNPIRYSDPEGDCVPWCLAIPLIELTVGEVAIGAGASAVGATIGTFADEILEGLGEVLRQGSAGGNLETMLNPSGKAPTLESWKAVFNSDQSQPQNQGQNQSSQSQSPTQPAATPSSASPSPQSPNNAPGNSNTPKTTKTTNKLKPDDKAAANHTSFKTDNAGKVYKYETYEKTSTGYWNPLIRYDGGKPDGSPGAPHVNSVTSQPVPTPHVQGKAIPGGVRPANSDEIPK